jgi:hypothetical protein
MGAPHCKMPTLHAIESELVQCRAELARLTPTWWDKRARWITDGTNPSMEDLYDSFVRNPTTPADLVCYMAGIFDNSNQAYRYVELNFLGGTVDAWIKDLFEWYYTKCILNKAWLSNNADTGNFTEERYITTKYTQFYTKLYIGGREIQIAWIRPNNGNILEVVFTRDTALYKSTAWWDALKAQCTTE